MITAYFQVEKNKSTRICADFAAGVPYYGRAIPATNFGGRVGVDTQVALYGITPHTIHIWHHCVKHNIPWYYIDNSYFDASREKYYRITRGAFQVTTLQSPNYQRWDALNITIKPWRQHGEAVVIVPQSDWHLSVLYPCGGKDQWTQRVIHQIRQYTTRPIKVRPWFNAKKTLMATYATDLETAWAVVTHTSAAANEAIIQGVPTFIGDQCAASPMASRDLSLLPNPPTPRGRRQWAAGLAANQWTRSEIRDGVAWRYLNGVGR